MTRRPPAPRPPWDGHRALRILHFGAFDRAVGRNAILADAMRTAGIERRVRHARLWRDTEDKMAAVRGSGVDAATRLATRWARSQARLARGALEEAAACDVLLVGATGHLDLPLARRLASRVGIPLVFDPLVSITETARDRGLLSAGSARSRAVHGVERALFRLPDLVLADTVAHAQAWQRELGLPAARCAELPIGARGLWRAAPPYVSRPPATISSTRPFTVMYFGQFIPLHGIEVILDAASHLRHRADIRFELVGRGQMLAPALARAAALELPNLRIHDTWLSEAELLEQHVSRADLCLGLFGSSPKADRVVPYKVHAALAAGRPVLSADTKALREQLVPGEEVAVVPAADSAALAAAVSRLAADPALRAGLATRGGSAHASRFSAEALGRQLRAQLEGLVAERDRAVGPRHHWRVARVGAALGEALAKGGRDAEAGATTLLDAGCGEGSLALSLAADQRHALVLACDRDGQRVRRARARARSAGVLDRVMLFVADVRALPLRSAAHGPPICGAACGEVLEHVEQDEQAAAELARVLDPGGALVVSVPAGPRRMSAIDQAVGHHRRYGRSALQRLLKDAGFAPESLAGWGFPFGRLYDVLVQRPVLSASDGRRRRASSWARNRWLDRAWRLLFDVDARLESLLERVESDDGWGSGWLLVARRPADPGARDPVASPGRLEPPRS